MEDRIHDAIKFLKDGLPFRINQLYLGIDNNGYLNVTKASNYIHIENVTKAITLVEMHDIKSIFQEMVSSSVELQEFVRDFIIKYNLDFDYGMGDTRICSEINGETIWQFNVKDKIRDYKQ